MLNNVFIQVTLMLRDYYKDVIGLNGNFAGKNPYSCQKLNGKVEIKT